MENIENFAALIKLFPDTITVNEYTIKWFRFLKNKLGLSSKDSSLIFRCFAFSSFIGKLLKESRFFEAGYFENEQAKFSSPIYNFCKADILGCPELEDIKFSKNSFFHAKYKSGLCKDDLKDIMTSLFIYQSCLVVILKDVKDWPNFYGRDQRPTMCWLHCLDPILTKYILELLELITEKNVTENIHFQSEMFYAENERNRLSNRIDISLLSSNYSQQKKSFGPFVVIQSIISSKTEANKDFQQTENQLEFPTDECVSFEKFIQPLIGSIMYHPIEASLRVLEFVKKNKDATEATIPFITVPARNKLYDIIE